MTMIIEVQSREWDVEQITAMLVIPAERGYVAHIETDDSNARTVLDRDFVLLAVDTVSDVLSVAEWNEDEQPALVGVRHEIDVADIRRIKFY